MTKGPYRFPLSVQITLPEHYQQEPKFQQNLKILQDYNFYGVELNIADPSRIILSDLQDFLQQFNPVHVGHFDIGQHDRRLSVSKYA